LVSQLEQRRAILFPLSLLLGGLLIAACSRKAEIENAPDGGSMVMMQVPMPDGGVPVVEDAGLGAGGAACDARPIQPACSGANDFGCAFDEWVRSLTSDCQQATDCRTDGWVEVVTDSEGCASELRMEDPNPDYVACMITALNGYRCGQCGDVLGSRFLGVSNEGCAPQTCSTGELRCPPGSRCEDGICVTVAENAGGGRD
jgi:hypothetical protein